MSERIFMLDGHYLIYRSYHAMKQAGLRDSSGHPTGAVFGLVRFLLGLQGEYSPDYLICSLDSEEPTYRHEFFEDYKANRPEMPEDLRVQISLVKELFELLEVPVLLEPGYESDDLLASSVKKWSDSTDKELVLVSNDKDLFQLVSDDVLVLKQSQGLTDVELIGPEEVESLLGVKPSKVPDYLSLVGDQADNIPGVSGIGSVYAEKLLGEFDSVGEMFERPQDIPDRFQDKIIENESDIRDSLKLIELQKDAELDLELDEARFSSESFRNLRRFCRELEFFSLIDRIDDLVGPLPEAEQEKDEIVSRQVEFEQLTEKLDESAGAVNCLFVNSDADQKPLATSRFWLFFASDSEVIWSELWFESASRSQVRDLLDYLNNQETVTFNLKHLYLCSFRLGHPPSVLENVFDLQLASYLLAPESDHSLLEVLRRHSDAELREPDTDDKDELLHWYISLAAAMPEAAGRLKQEADDKNQQDILTRLEQPLARELAFMESRGIRIDQDQLMDFSEELQKKLEKLQNQAHEIVDEEFNLNSPKQLRRILFQKLDLPVQGKTDSGKPSTDADTLENLAEDHELPGVILDYRRYKKMDSTYLSPLVEAVNERTGRLHTEFNQTVTATGRLSSSNPNLQNIPVREDFGRRVRKAFVPGDSDQLLMAADYSQIELRLLAHFSGDDTLREAFREGRDIHSITAAELTDRELDEVEVSDRRLAKVINYGIAYGLSEFGLARDLEVSREEAAEYIDSYFDRYPGVESYVEDTVGEAREQGYVTTILGRRRYIHDINSDDYFQRQFARRSAVNAPIQGSASDMIKKAMVELPPELRGFDADVLLQIHDELLLEVQAKEAEEVARILREVMCDTLELEVPVEVELKIGDSWAEVSK